MRSSIVETSTFCAESEWFTRSGVLQRGGPGISSSIPALMARSTLYVPNLLNRPRKYSGRGGSIRSDKNVYQSLMTIPSNPHSFRRMSCKK